MAGNAGRQITFTWDGAEILGCREKGLTINGEPVDVSSDEDDGWRTLLEDIAGETKVDISISGVTKDRVLRVASLSAARSKTAVFTWPNGDTLTATFFLSSYDEKQPYKDAVTFDAKFASSGIVTYTAGP
jgi:predicted secreted protein